MTRTGLHHTHVWAAFLSLATVTGCKEDDAICGGSCGTSDFTAVVEFDPGVAEQVALELCRNKQCALGSGPADEDFGVHAGSLESGGVSFGVQMADAGLPTAYARWTFEQDTKLPDGDVYRLTITDADSKQVLFTHSEAVTYSRVRFCGVCSHGTFAGFDDAGSPIPP